MAESQAGYIRLCEFPVSSRLERRFERTYGPSGDWAGLFRRGKGFLGTRLYRDTTQRGRYVTADFWTTEAKYRAFLRKFGVEYDALNAECARFNRNEKPIGDFHVISGRFALRAVRLSGPRTRGRRAPTRIC